MLKAMVAEIPAPDLLAVRFAIAAVALALVAPRSVLRLSGRTRLKGLALGTFYGLAQILQTEGLAHTSASVNGFLTGLYVVFTPLLAGLFLRHRIGRMAWIASVVATAGLAVLSLRGLAMGYGELLTICSALFYAIHILALGTWTTAKDALGLSVVQMFAIAAVCSIAAIPGGITMPASSGDWLVIGYMAIVAGALAMIAQTWAQAHLTATRTAIIICMEPVWATFFAILFGGESLTARMLIGGTLVLASMYLVEVTPRRRHIEGETTHLAV